MTKSNTEIILDDAAIAEIEARANAATEGPWASDNAEDSEHRYQYYMAIDPESRVLFDTFNSAMGEIHEEADEDGVYRWDEVARRNIAFASHARTDIPALTRDWRALRQQLATANKQRDDALVRAAEDQDEHSAQRAALVVQLEQVTKELAEEKRLRAELKEIAQAGIAEVSSVGTVLKDNALTDFRLRAIQLCRDKADEYAKAAQGYTLDDRFRLCLSSKREAYSDAAIGLEQLK